MELQTRMRRSALKEKHIPCKFPVSGRLANFESHIPYDNERGCNPYIDDNKVSEIEPVTLLKGTTTNWHISQSVSKTTSSPWNVLLNRRLNLLTYVTNTLKYN